jgi:ABC-type branched-subunit amino acid transport system ATPase component
MTSILEIKKLYKSFGGLVALNEISFNVDSGEIIGLIGPNGAGKTTLFNCVAGIEKPTEAETVQSPSAAGNRKRSPLWGSPAHFKTSGSLTT